PSRRTKNRTGHVAPSSEQLDPGEVPPPGETGTRRRLAGFLIGGGIFLVMLLLPPPTGMDPSAWRVAAAGALMATWWITEPIPIPATSLLPLALFPLLGIAGIEAASAPYGNSVIFLFLGGFLL